MTLITLPLQLLLGAFLLSLACAMALRPHWLSKSGITAPRSTIWRIIASGFLALGGLLTWIGAAVPFVAFFSACLVLAAAVFMALRTSGVAHTLRWLPSTLTAVAAVVVGIGQPLGLKVLALPKAADLAYAAVPSRVVKTYDEGLWFEGVAAGSDGTLYLSGNRHLDFSRSDYYRQAEGEVIARRPDGTERILFKTPVGSTAGVLAVAPDGSLYMSSHGASPVIWHIAADGSGEPVVRLPRGAWPNGLDIGPDGKLYSPDSALGVVWRIDPQAKTAERAIESPRLLARPFLSLAPGANGLHFRGRNMYVTVSDQTTVLKYALDPSGHFAEPALVATGIPGDDFAIGRDGSLFITTHPYNTLVQVRTDGSRTIIGKEAQHIVGATDAVFGTGAADRDTLYVVTDGGAFTGGPKSRGQLVALRPYGN